MAHMSKQKENQDPNQVRILSPVRVLQVLASSVELTMLYCTRRIRQELFLKHNNDCPL